MSLPTSRPSSRLTSLGWDAAKDAAFAPHGAHGLVAGRVLEDHRDLRRVALEDGDVLADLAGRLFHEAPDRTHLPAVGDWVACDPVPPGGRSVVRAVLPRRSLLVRKSAGTSSEAQVVAANVEVVLVATAAEADLSERRLERYLAFAWESGAHPVVLLTKSDLHPDPERLVARIRAASPGAPVLAVSAVTGTGLDLLAEHLRPGQTAVLVGSSGVGKSTLVNRLLGAEVQRTQEVRARDGRGTHTTTSRRLVVLESGALLVDTPGMRELALLDDDGLDAAFADIEALALRCRFTDCSHVHEPACAVRTAVEAGDIAEDRLEGWRRLRREIAYLARRDDARAMLAERRKWKQISKEARRRDK